jgi:hypothetical protein
VQRAGAVAILAVVLASASLVQGGGWNQGAHLALVKALSHGTPVIDRYRGETGDLAFHDGHYYSAKAPGVALLAVGPYVLLDRSGALDRMARTSGIGRNDVDLWAIAALVCALALGVTLWLVMLLGDEVAPGYGAITAVTLGLGTLLLPFSTVVFAHVPATAFAFAAFAILWRHRWEHGWLLLAGLLAGLAVTVEYPLVICALALGLYAIARGDALRRGIAYAVGALLGAAPLFAYNTWAFGSPLRFPYDYAVPIGGQPSNERGLFGISWPSPDTATHLLFGGRGLVVITPVVLCGAAALVPLYRRDRRDEALVIAGMALAFLAYNAGYDVPFGGDSPGPRFLIAILPFLAVPLALSWALWPWLTAALAVPSIVYAVGVTVTGPLQASGWGWVTNGTGATTAELVRFLALVVTAAVLAALSIPTRSRASGGTSSAR